VVNFGEAILEKDELKNADIAKAMASIFKEVYLQKRPPERGSYSFTITKLEIKRYQNVYTQIS
jgi:hypothetical protein